MNATTTQDTKPVGAVDPAVWPICQQAMRARTRVLLKRGMSDQSIGRVLMQDFPGLLLEGGAEWRRGARYALVIADEQMRAWKSRRSSREMAG